MDDARHLPGQSGSHQAVDGRPRRNRGRWLAGLVLLGIAAVAADGAWRTPADPVDVLKVEGARRLGHLEGATTIRVATFNIHAGVGQDGRRDLERTAACLLDLDIVTLQEVRNPGWGSSGLQAAAIAERLGMAWLFVPTERRWWHNHYGDALLTRTPLTAWCRLPLPTPSRHTFRAALLADFRHRNRTVHLLAVHLDTDGHGGSRELQLRMVSDLFLSLNEPAILLGDLNTGASHPELVRLLGTSGVHNALADAAPPGHASRPVDWILTRGFRTVQAEWRGNSASDHPVALAELELLDSSCAPTTSPEASQGLNLESNAQADKVFLLK